MNGVPPPDIPPPPKSRPRQPRWLLVLAATLLVATAVVLGSVTIGTDERSPMPSSGPSPTPTIGIPPSPVPPSAVLATLRVVPGPTPDGSPPGWRGWVANDGSFAFVAPPGAEPRGIPSIEDEIWELSFRGHVVHIFVYVSDAYRIGPSPMTSLRLISEGLTAGGTVFRRSIVESHGRDAWEVFYRERTGQYVYLVRLYAVHGRYFQASAGFPEMLDGPDLRKQARLFLDSFVIHANLIERAGAVAGGS